MLLQGRWDGLILDEMADQLTFTDFHLGLHHGWASVTRATGQGPVLMMVPEAGATFEAWHSHREDAANAGPLWTPGIMLHSKAHQVHYSLQLSVIKLLLEHFRCLFCSESHAYDKATQSSLL